MALYTFINLSIAASSEHVNSSTDGGYTRSESRDIRTYRLSESRRLCACQCHHVLCSRISKLPPSTRFYSRRRRSKPKFWRYLRKLSHPSDSPLDSVKKFAAFFCSPPTAKTWSLFATAQSAHRLVPSGAIISQASLSGPYF